MIHDSCNCSIIIAITINLYFLWLARLSIRQQGNIARIPKHLKQFIKHETPSHQNNTSGYQFEAWNFPFFFSPPRNSLPQASKNDDFRAGALPQPCAARFGRSHMNCSTGGLKTWDSHKGRIRTIPFHQGGCSFKVNQTKLNQTTIATSSCFIEIWEWFGSSQGNCNSSRTYSAWPDVNVNKKASAMNYLWQFSFFPLNEKQVPFEKNTYP